MSISIILLVCSAFGLLLSFWPNFLIKLSMYLGLGLLIAGAVTLLVVLVAAFALYAKGLGASLWVAGVLAVGVFFALIYSYLLRAIESVVAPIIKLIRTNNAMEVTS